MARDWSREPYRKWLEKPSAPWRALPVLVRGLGAELMLVADPDGSIRVGTADKEKAVSVLRRLLGAHARERKMVGSYIDIILTDGFMKWEPESERFFIRNQERINIRRGPSAAPARHEGGPSAAPARHEGGPESDATSRNYSTEKSCPSRARARDQVGREVGREVEGAASPLLAPPSKRKTRCPESTDRLGAVTFATEWGLDPAHREFPKFLDYHRSKGNLMLDWAAAWRTWMRNGSRFGDDRTSPGGDTFATLSKKAASY